MKKIKFIFSVLIFILFVFTNCSSQNNKTKMKLINRQPAVAGEFYPSEPKELRTTLKELFTEAVPKKTKNVLAIIAPHAGYVFSGKVAASSFNQIDENKKYENIFIIGPSHHASFSGASIYSKGNYITPLGTVKVNIPLAEKLIKEYDFFHFYLDVHYYEHCIEVELPFLQYKMKKDFKIIPIVIGSASPKVCKKIAKALKPYFNDKNLFIISTDFSHYPKYQDAVENDKRTADAILSNSANNLIKTLNDNASRNIPNLVTSLCGRYAVLTLLYMTENNPDIKVIPIFSRNSGDTEYGDKDRVVGYYSIAFTLKNEDDKEFNFNEEDKKELLKIARKSIEQYIKKNKIPQIDTKTFSKDLFTKCGAFVTLTENGKLRGCIGRFIADEPVYKVVQQMAIAAATQDSRFPKVTASEIDNIKIEISILSPLKKIQSVDEIQLGKNGIYIKKGWASGTFLPQVAKETGWTKEEFLGHCARDKAGIGWNGWKDADIYTYDAEVFDEDMLK